MRDEWAGAVQPVMGVWPCRASDWSGIVRHASDLGDFCSDLVGDGRQLGHQAGVLGPPGE
jgi:hypothetical protein